MCLHSIWTKQVTSTVDQPRVSKLHTEQNDPIKGYEVALLLASYWGGKSKCSIHTPGATYHQSNSVEWRPSWEAESHSAEQEIIRVLWNLKVHSRLQKNPPWRIIDKNNHSVFLRIVTPCCLWGSMFFRKVSSPHGVTIQKITLRMFFFYNTQFSRSELVHAKKYVFVFQVFMVQTSRLTYLKVS